MQLTPAFIESIMFIALIMMGLAALFLIMGYTIYGEEEDDE